MNRKKQPSLNDNCLVELHLGSLSVSADQLTTVLQLAPNIKLLRHYQMVSALYKLHADGWKNGHSIPKYKLNNLDADFSHVVSTVFHIFYLLSTKILPHEKCIIA